MHALSLPQPRPRRSWCQILPIGGLLIAALYGLNGRFGQDTVHVASTGVDDHKRVWGMRQERRTPQYTTRWDEGAIART